MRLKLSICFLSLSCTYYAQTSTTVDSIVPCTRVWLKGRVIDTLNSQNFLNLMVVNTSTGKGVFGQANGSFAVYVNQNDSIVLSIKGYPRIGFRIVADSNCQYLANYGVSKEATELAGVTVKPLKSIQQIREERAALALRETRTITGLEAFQSPITALYQRFSHKEQSKQIVAGKEYIDSKETLLQELLKLYVSYDVIQLTPDEFLDFIRFMAIDEDFLKTANDFELIQFIKEKFEHYQLMYPKK